MVGRGMRDKRRLLNTWLVIHAVITLAAGVVLIIAPQAIPHTVDITLPVKAQLLAYFLGAAEIAIAFLSYMARTIKDIHALSIIIWTFILFHAATTLVEVYDMIINGFSTVLLLNIGVRVAAISLFVYLGKSKK